MNKKYYKVYANCCRHAHPVKEIDRDEAWECIMEAVNDYYSDTALPLAEDATWKEIDDFTEKMYDAALLFFERNGCFECGDFAIYYGDEMPTRGNRYGNNTSLL